jgi:hypothetical protein
VRALAQQLADDVADAEGRQRVQVPDLGPAVVMDQLTVMVYDGTAGGTGDDPHSVGGRLRALRGTLP